MVVGIRRLGTLITGPIPDTSAQSISNTTLHTPLEHAYLFTAASTARLGVGFLFNRLIRSQISIWLFLNRNHFLLEWEE